MLKIITALSLMIGSQTSSDTYAITMRQEGDCSLEKTCHAVVEAIPLGSMHINEAYPTRFKITSHDACAFYPKQVIDKSGGKVTKDIVHLDIPFVPNSSGMSTLKGTFYFSLCNDNACHLEKVDLSTTINTL